MFIRAKRSVQNGRTYEYLQLVEGYREGKKVRQRVLANLGPKAEFIAEGKLDALLRSMANFSERLRVVDSVRSDGLDARAARAWGPALVFRRLWEKQGLPEMLGELARRRRFQFDVERAVFALALQRLCDPGSDRQGAAWLGTVECPGFEALRLQHLYRAVNFLAETRDELEATLFRHDHPDGQPVDLVFVDTTSTYVCSGASTDLRRRGYSRDRRPELVQVVLCVAVDAQGWPVGWDIHPGNTADKTAFVAMIGKMRERFALRRCIVVADRGMISATTLTLLEGHAEAPFDYILGCRMRNQREVNDEVLSRAGRYHKVDDRLEVKQVRVGDRRYVVCRNPAEVRKDAQDRAAIVARLEEVLAQGAKSLVGNKGYARFLRGARGAWSIDHDAVEADARLDGKWVLRTNTELPPDEVARAYKGLWRVERAFREQKATLEVRPVYHQRDDTTIGHIVGCFLALRLEVDLQRRLDEADVDVYWPDLMRDLHEVRAVDVAVDGQLYRLRTPFVGDAHRAFAAAGIRPPPVLTPLGAASARPPEPEEAPGL
jgi:hypothetical protein